MDPNQHRFGSIAPAGPGCPALGHRRAHSDPDFSISDIGSPSVSDENPSAGPVQSDRPVHPAAGGSHGRSLSVDAAFLGGLGSGSGGARHCRSGSGGDSATSDSTRKPMDAVKLAELLVRDPKRARRIIANRQSAARSKERKTRHTNELERKVEALRTEATELTAQLAVMERDTMAACAKNRELKLQLEAMEQEARLREAFNDTLEKDIYRLKMATAEFPNINGTAINRGLARRQPQVPNSIVHQAQQRQAPQPPSSSNGQSRGDRSQK